MHLLKKALLITFILFAGIIGFIYYNNRPLADSLYDRWFTFSFCDEPITYKIGAVDSRFDLTHDEFGQHVRAGAEIWNRAYSQPLLKYNTRGDLTVNLVYDERQKVLTQINDIQENVVEEKSQLDTEVENYEQDRENLRNQIQQLNQEIQHWNERGGAPPEEYQRLIDKQAELQEKAERLNKLGQNINEYVGQVNTQINKLNKTAGAFNSLLNVKPEEGIYKAGPNEIDIFFYSSDAKLEHTLAHEFGHAIGLSHLSNEEAVMYPISNDRGDLTSDDLQLLYDFCERQDKIALILNDVENILTTFYNQKIN